jgi:hypothetical protein
MKPFQINVSSKFGAPMGRFSDNPENFSGSVHLEVVPFVDGDYDEGGAYWGGGEEAIPVYCAWDNTGAVLYLRAKSSKDAKAQLPQSWEYVAPEISDFVKGYIDCALWSSTAEIEEGSDRSFSDEGFSACDLAQETLDKFVADCAAFQITAAEELAVTAVADSTNGHDFWLTRNGHGCGFWDRGYGPTGDVLTKKAKAFGEVCLYLGNDRKIYQG